MGKKRNAYGIIVVNQNENRQLGRPRHRLVNNIKAHIRVIGRIGVDWIDLAQDRDMWRAVVRRLMTL
jgi:hypothetical protein